MRRALPALVFLTALPALAENRIPAAVGIIIDDLGNSLRSGQRVVQLPGPVACAVLPHTRYGPAIADLARGNGKEILLHLPMPAGDRIEPGPGQIESGISDGELRATLDLDLATVPHALGVSNHMGSRLTRDTQAMDQLMRQLWTRRMWFVDSRTHESSVAADRARRMGIPTLERNVFLDSDPDPAAIARQLSRLERAARRHGFALAIGHPHPATLAALEHWLPNLVERGIRLVSLADRLAQRIPNREAPRSWQAYSSR